MGLFNRRKKKHTENNNNYLEWQNTLLDKPYDGLLMSERQLREETTARIENDLRIIQDCLKILDSTINPDVFFSRLELLKKRTADIVIFEKYINFADAKPSEAMAEVASNKQIAISQFLARYFCATEEKASTLKTDKGKFNQYQKFYDSLQPYYQNMDSDNIGYIETKYHSYAKGLE